MRLSLGNVAQQQTEPVMVIVRVSISAGKMDMRLQHFLILIRHLAPLRNLSGSTGPEEDIGMLCSGRETCDNLNTIAAMLGTKNTPNSPVLNTSLVG